MIQGEGEKATMVRQEVLPEAKFPLGNHSLLSSAESGMGRGKSLKGVVQFCLKGYGSVF